MLSEHLATELEKHFGDRGLKLHGAAQPAVSFTPVHPSWSPIEIWDDGDEVTVDFGNFTHVHFGNYDTGLSVVEREKKIISDVIAFLDDVFADKIEFFKTWFGGGGCRTRGSQGKWSRRLLGRQQAFVWSGPVSRQATSAQGS